MARVWFSLRISAGRRPAMLGRLVFGLLMLVRCTPAPRGPYFGDDKLLRFGVDPQAEASEVEAAFGRAGQRRVQRLVGKHFTALGFADAAGNPTSVRVVTARGIALALDGNPGHALRPRVAYRLLSRPIPETHDADGDGFDEVFVLRREGQRGCVQLYRVRDVGFVDPVKIRLPEALVGESEAEGAGQACVERVVDRDGDGRVELLADWTLTDVPLAIQPTLRVALVPSAHDYVLGSAPAYYRQELTAAELQLADAVQRGAIERAYALITRIAAYRFLGGAGPEAQLAQLQAGFASLPAAQRRPAWEQALEARFRAGLLPEGAAEREAEAVSPGTPPAPTGSALSETPAADAGLAPPAP